MGKVKIGHKILVLCTILMIQAQALAGTDSIDVSRIIWKKPTGGKVISLNQSPMHTWIYALSEDRTIHCYTLDGIQLWQSEVLPDRPVGRAVIGPDETIYVQTGRNELYAFNPAGKIVWTAGLSGRITGQPAVTREGMIIYATEKGIIAGRTHLGLLVWEQVLESPPLSSLEADGSGRYWLILENGTVLSIDGNGITENRISLNGNGPIIGEYPNSSLRCDGKGVCILSGTSIILFDGKGRFLWSRSMDGLLRESLLMEDFVITVLSDGQVSALDRSSGEILWTLRLSFDRTVYASMDKQGRNFSIATENVTRVLEAATGDILGQFPAPRPAARPLITENSLILGGDDWVVYRFPLSLPEEIDGGEGKIDKPSKGRGYDNTELISESPKVMYTREIMRLADRNVFDDFLNKLEVDLASLKPKSDFQSSLVSAENLAGVGVFNPINRNGFLINDFPEIRIRSIQLLSRYGTLNSRNTLLRLLRFDWDPVVSKTIIESLGSLRSDPDGEIVDTLEFLYHHGRIPVQNNPGIADSLIDCIDSICRYSGMVRPSASRLLNELYMAPIPRDLRLKAIETLRGFSEKK